MHSFSACISYSAILFSANLISNMKTRAATSLRDPSTSVTINNTCQICDEKFTRNRDLILHMNDNHSEIMAYECKTCLTKFYSINSFNWHMSSHSETEVSTEEETIECDTLTSQKDFHDPHDLLYCPDNQSKHEYGCEVCGKVFSHKCMVTQHMVVHTGVKNFVCEFCGKAYTSSGCLSTHMNTHTDVRKFECEFCDKKFQLKSSLRQHIMTHNGAKKFKCETCNKAFHRLGDLSRHVTFHNGVKNYKCEICEKSYSTSGHLARHKKTHTGSKPFKCDECGKCYAEKTLLAQHANIHSGVKFTCDTCGKSYTRKRSLTRHKKIHFCGTIKTRECETEKTCPKSHTIVHGELKVTVSDKTVSDKVLASSTTISSVVKAVLSELSAGPSSLSGIPETTSEES